MSYKPSGPLDKAVRGNLKPSSPLGKAVQGNLKPLSPLSKAVGGNPKPWQPRPGYLAGSPLIRGTPMKNFLEVLFIDHFRFSLSFLIMLYCNSGTVCSDIG